MKSGPPQTTWYRHRVRFPCECGRGNLGLPLEAWIADDGGSYTVSLWCRACNTKTNLTFPLDDTVTVEREGRIHD